MQVRTRVMTSVAALSVVLLGLLGGIAVPAGLSLHGIITEIGEAQRTIDARFAAQRYVRGARADFDATVKKVAALSSTAVREERELELVTAIEDAAERRGVQQTLLLETANQKDISPWEKEIPIKVEATGDFPAVARFLNDIERLPYLVTFSAVRVGAPRSEEGARSGRVTAVLEGTVYWQSASTPDFAALPDGAR